MLCGLQLSYRERRVARSHRQGHRWLHEEENNLHIKPKSGGGENEAQRVFLGINSSLVLLRYPSISGNTGGVRRWQQRPIRFKGSHLDPGPEGDHVYDLYLRVHPHLEEASLSRMWQGHLSRRYTCSNGVLFIQQLFSSQSYCVFDRWCVRRALPTSTTWSTWRTSRHVCVITALPSYRRTVSDHIPCILPCSKVNFGGGGELLHRAVL